MFTGFDFEVIQKSLPYLWEGMQFSLGLTLLAMLGGAAFEAGRPFYPADIAAAKALMKEGSLPVRDIARRLNVSVATLYRYAGKRGGAADGVEADRLRA